jgi:WD40 repeat protein
VGEQALGTVRLWDLETGRCGLLESELSGPVFSIAFSPDGSLLAAAGPSERVVPIWDLRDGQVCRRIRGHVGGTASVNFSPDGATLATAGNDGMVRLWSVRTAGLRICLNGRAPGLSKVAFTADGRAVVACAGNDSHVRLWDVEEGVRADAGPQGDDSTHAAPLLNERSPYLPEADHHGQVGP